MFPNGIYRVTTNKVKGWPSSSLSSDSQVPIGDVVLTLDCWPNRIKSDTIPLKYYLKDSLSRYNVLKMVVDCHFEKTGRQQERSRSTFLINAALTIQLFNQLVVLQLNRLKTSHRDVTFMKGIFERCEFNNLKQIVLFHNIRDLQWASTPDSMSTTVMMAYLAPAQTLWFYGRNQGLVLNRVEYNTLYLHLKARGKLDYLLNTNTVYFNNDVSSHNITSTELGKTYRQLYRMPHPNETVYSFESNLSASDTFFQHNDWLKYLFNDLRRHFLSEAELNS